MSEHNDAVEFEPEWRFTDRTILEADGEFLAACEIMRDEPKPWCLNSRLTLLHPFGVCEMTLEFFDTGLIKIIDFRPSVPDPLLNFDLRCLRAWADANGWGKPTASWHIISAGLGFWKHMWEVDVIDSQELEDRYGKREEIDYKAENTQRDDGQATEPQEG